MGGPKSGILTDGIAIADALSLQQTKGMRRGRRNMEQQQANSNTVSDETGQFDPRFILWRKFCADQGVALDTLPSDLIGEVKERWEKLKKGELGSTSG
jgi:hypothetical protein